QALHAARRRVLHLEARRRLAAADLDPTGHDPRHVRAAGHDAIQDRIMTRCPHVTRIVPGRIKVRRGKTPPSFKVQYATPSGVKCLYNGTGTVQEVFIVSNDAAAVEAWLVAEGFVK
ncbi:hypothetical protein EON77_17050, partial [bacterium]